MSRLFQSGIRLPAIETPEGSQDSEGLLEASTAGQTAETDSLLYGACRRVPARHHSPAESFVFVLIDRAV